MVDFLKVHAKAAYHHKQYDYLNPHKRVTKVHVLLAVVGFVVFVLFANWVSDKCEQRMKPILETRALQVR